jgi:predicted nuclease with TOPRIM domain
LEDFQDLEHVNKSLVTKLSESHALIDSLKSENLVLGSKVDLLENKLKELETRLEKFSSNSLENIMHTKNSDWDEFELSFDCNADLSSKNDSISKIMFVKSEKVEDSLVERNIAAAPTTQVRNVRKFILNLVYLTPRIESFILLGIYLLKGLFLLVIIAEKYVTFDQIVLS